MDLFASTKTHKIQLNLICNKDGLIPDQNNQVNAN